MSTAPRIDELRRKFDENPRRYFAPLANEYRKAGDLAQAIALCREHLPKQPGHMSGHIVFGQALFENGELAEARSVFESALALDPENLIALRHLGDIAKAMGDAPAARRWYERVLDADPRNDDIAAQLATLATGLTPQSVPAVDPRFGAPSIGGPTVRVGSTTGDVPAFSMPPLPTPDSSMRAVDFDAVNEQIARFTPLDLDAMEDSTSAPVESRGEVDGAAVSRESPESPESPESGSSVEDHGADDRDDVAGYGMTTLADPTAIDELLDVPAFEYPGTVSLDAADAEAATDHAPAHDAAWRDASLPEATGDDQFHVEAHVESLVEAHVENTAETTSEAGQGTESESRSTNDATTDVHDGAIADDRIVAGVGSADPQIDVPDDAPDAAPDDAPDDAPAMSAADFDEFEEGLLAPEWPDTSALVARLATPRSGTPVASDGAHEDDAPSSEPSPALEVEAGWAFGREPHEASLIEPPIEIPVSLEGDEPPVTETLSADEVTANEVTADQAPAEAVVATVASAEEGAEVAGEAADQASIAQSEVVSFADVLPEELAAEEDEEPAPPPPAFVTETMGELLVSQGFIDRAVTVYEELVRRRPYDPVLSSRLDELRARLAPASDEPAAAAVSESVNDADGSDSEMFEMETRSSDATYEDPGVLPIAGSTAYATPRATPAQMAPVMATPAYFTPVQGTPVFVNAMSSASDETAEPVPTAREIFSRLAARRVPRRTPPRAMPAVVDAPEQSLSSLFGQESGGQDDRAARALADAFAPISAQELATGQALDADFARAFATSSEPQSFTPPATSATSPTSATSASTAPVSRGPAFSFDRFFPDPATDASSATPKASAASGESGTREETPRAPEAAPAPVDDLAEFSAWLKGLGKS